VDHFVIAAVLIALFVGRMARLVRQRDGELAAMRENALRDQQIVELGTLAAGTAHELNTPLSTLAILASELDETATDPVQKQQLRAMLDEKHGLGIGLLLSRAALQRFGGRRDLKDAPRGGVEAHIELPLDELLADAR
jgi:signal transduction histidine kinase